MEGGDKVELNICLGEERHGIDEDKFEGLCRNRLAEYVRDNASRYSDYQHRISCYDREWNFPTYALRVIGERHENR